MHVKTENASNRIQTIPRHHFAKETIFHGNIMPRESSLFEFSVIEW